MKVDCEWETVTLWFYCAVWDSNQYHPITPGWPGVQDWTGQSRNRELCPVSRTILFLDIDTSRNRIIFIQNMRKKMFCVFISFIVFSIANSEKTVKYVKINSIMFLYWVHSLLKNYWKLLSINMHKTLNLLKLKRCTHYLIMNATGRPSGIQSPDIFYNH